MECKKCGNEIKEGEKFCSKCGTNVDKKSKKNIVIIGSIIGIVCIIAVIIGIYVIKTNHSSVETSSNDVILNQDSENNGENYNQIDNDDYVDFHRTPDWYEDPYNTGEEIKMPNLVGMNCSDLRNYLDTNYLYFITDIKYKYNEEESKYFRLPSKILSTIPSEGTILDRYTDTSITVLADYYIGVKSIRLSIDDENIESNNFGKTIKMQFGNGSTLEGIIGKDFTKQSRSGDSYLRYNVKKTKDVEYWDLANQNKIAYFSKDELIFEGNDTYIDGKIWIDNQLIKQKRFGCGSDGLIYGEF